MELTSSEVTILQWLYAIEDFSRLYKPTGWVATVTLAASMTEAPAVNTGLIVTCEKWLEASSNTLWPSAYARLEKTTRAVIKIR